MSTNSDKSAGGCVKFPACGCADPFASRWPACVFPSEKSAPAAEVSTCGDNASCGFHPECGCADAGNCPMKSK